MPSVPASSSSLGVFMCALVLIHVAVNMLAHGRKRWSLWPPSSAFYSLEPVAMRWRRERDAAAAAAGTSSTSSSSSSSSSTVKKSTAATSGLWDPAAPLSCVQEAGDVVYVPTSWGHATLNEKQSIGVAHEVFFDPFCSGFG